MSRARGGILLLYLLEFTPSSPRCPTHPGAWSSRRLGLQGALALAPRPTLTLDLGVLQPAFCLQTSLCAPKVWASVSLSYGMKEDWCVKGGGRELVYRSPETAPPQPSRETGLKFLAYVNHMLQWDLIQEHQEAPEH